MIWKEEISAAAAVGVNFKPAITAARYLGEFDKVELVTRLCTLLVDRKAIRELRDVEPEAMKTICVSAYGVHVEAADIDINSAGLIVDLAERLRAEAAGSL